MSLTVGDDCAGTRFYPMLLLPLIQRAVRMDDSGLPESIRIGVQKVGSEAVIVVRIAGAGGCTEDFELARVLERLADIVGFCGLVHPAGQQVPEAKYALRRGQWGKGFATEALSGLLRYGASAFGMKEVIATTAPENVASHRVLLKAGMQRGALRNNDDGSFTQLFVWRPADAEVRG